MKVLADFVLKEDYKCLQLVGGKLAEIDPSIDWKPFRIIFESIFFNETASKSINEADIIIMLKMLVLYQWHGLSDFELWKRVLIKFLSKNVLVFLSTYTDSKPFW